MNHQTKLKQKLLPKPHSCPPFKRNFRCLIMTHQQLTIINLFLSSYNIPGQLFSSMFYATDELRSNRNSCASFRKGNRPPRTKSPNYFVIKFCPGNTRWTFKPVAGWENNHLFRAKRYDEREVLSPVFRLLVGKRKNATHLGDCKANIHSAVR